MCVFSQSICRILQVNSRQWGSPWSVPCPPPGTAEPLFFNGTVYLPHWTNTNHCWEQRLNSHEVCTVWFLKTRCETNFRSETTRSIILSIPLEKQNSMFLLSVRTQRCKSLISAELKVLSAFKVELLHMRPNSSAPPTLSINANWHHRTLHGCHLGSVKGDIRKDSARSFLRPLGDRVTLLAHY